jgi:sec-independent protein translocase protein TatA
MPSWIGWPELVVIAVIALIVFGPRRLPELGSSIGKAITSFRQGLKDAEQEVKRSVGAGSEPAHPPGSETADRQAERDGLLLAAVSDGRIAPPQVEYYRALYDKDPETVSNLLALAPAAVSAAVDAPGTEEKPA